MSVQDLAQLVESSKAGLLEVEEAELPYYYDTHPTKEDLMSENAPQFYLVQYLINVLTWYYYKQNWFIIGNMNIYPKTRNLRKYPLAPDVAVFIGLVKPEEARKRLRSWQMIKPNRPAPSVVFEISSDSTWFEDLNDKPGKYHRLGVKEYFAYDPNDPSYWTDTSTRLRGWRYKGKQMIELVPNERGWLWSEELESWLVPDNEFLRLYDHAGQLRLTQAEAAERETATERRAKEAAWAKLRELGIDPEKL